MMQKYPGGRSFATPRFRVEDNRGLVRQPADWALQEGYRTPEKIIEPTIFKTRKDYIDAHEQILSFSKDPLAFRNTYVI